MARHGTRVTSAGKRVVAASGRGIAGAVECENCLEN